MPSKFIVGLLVASVAVAAGIGGAPAPSMLAAHRPMSVDNRLLLNRIAIAGLPRIEVMLIVNRERADAVASRVTAAGGRVDRLDREVGYMRVTIPTSALLEVADAPDVDAYQISTFSRGKWYREGWPEAEGDAFRRAEVSAPFGLTAAETSANLPRLSVKASRTAGYTADEDTGVGAWMREHPTFDGRGVTVALIETGEPDFTHLISATARTIDGRTIPKIAGVLNAIDPDAPDETRVTLDTPVHATSAWVRIGRRTFIIPKPGTYRFGVFVLPMGSNLRYEFGVLEDDVSGDVRIDTNGDASFQDEPALADVNERIDVHFLKLTYPRKLNLSFVIARGRRPHTIHVYCGRDDHQSMTLSVAAGSQDYGLASGVAPGARVLLVRARSHRARLVDFVEGYIAASARSDVNIISDSEGSHSTPDAAQGFIGSLIRRLVAVHGKPIFRGAGNEQLVLDVADSGDNAFAVGGSIGPRTFAALFGGGVLNRVLVHPTSSGGPAMDGRVKPDFLAPMERLSAGTSWQPPLRLPKNHPIWSTGAGYEISCCTSASSPYAAGVAALLLSAARQQHVDASLARLSSALRTGARFLEGAPSYLQGNGILDVDAAWQELTHPIDAVRIRSTAPIVHPLASYALHGTEGEGIFEIGGWTAGATGHRAIQLRRESGPPEPITYRVAWTGNDGTFAAPTTVTLPLDSTVTLPIAIAVGTPGVRSALLDLNDPATGRLALRTQATIVAPRSFNRETGTIQVHGVVPLMHADTHYVEVPAGTGAVEITIAVTRGIVRPMLIPSHALFPGSDVHKGHGIGPQLGKGSHTIVLAQPMPGPWAITLTNNGVWQEPAKIAGEDAEYGMTVRLLRASLRVREADRGNSSIEIENRGSAIRAPVLESSAAVVESREGSFESSGMPSVFDIAVPQGASSLILRARSASEATLELHLYECVTGECFLHDFTLPALREQTLLVRQPHPGRWKVAVNSAPNPAMEDRFTLEQIVALGHPHRTPLSGDLAPSASISALHLTDPTLPGDSHAVLYEIVDAAAERDIRDHAWGPGATDRPAAGWLIGVGR
jgi:hypothetical protein